MAPEGQLASLEQHCRELEAQCARMRERIQAMDRAASDAGVEGKRQLQAQIDLLQAMLVEISRRASEPQRGAGTGWSLRRLMKSFLGPPKEDPEIRRTVEELRRLAQTLISSTSR